MTRAFLFPGQGSQAVGMGKALAGAFAVARRVFEEVDDALSEKLSRLMWEGPEGDLTRTENAQPAIMAGSLAVIAVLEKEAGLDLARHARLVAGHSLGEYSALTACRAFTLSDAARLLRIRGRAMQSAVPVGEGAMIALIGADIDLAEKVAKEAAQDDICVIANDNAPGQVVLSGAKAAMDRVPDIAKANGVKRSIPLSVSAPFHCSLMQPAADVMAEALAKVSMQPLTVPVLSNVTAKEASDPEAIRQLLVEQVTSRVRWRESMLALKGLGVDMAVEMGGNKILTGMMRRIDKEIEALALDTPAEIEAFAKGL